MKHPYAIPYTKKNEIRPFENPASLEFFGKKSESALFCFGSHSKKRPNNLTLGRFFDVSFFFFFFFFFLLYCLLFIFIILLLSLKKILTSQIQESLLDMIELGVKNFTSMNKLNVVKSAIGSNPCFIFKGDKFEVRRGKGREGKGREGKGREGKGGKRREEKRREEKRREEKRREEKRREEKRREEKRREGKRGKKRREEGKEGEERRKRTGCF